MSERFVWMGDLKCLAKISTHLLENDKWQWKWELFWSLYIIGGCQNNNLQQEITLINGICKKTNNYLLLQFWNSTECLQNHFSEKTKKLCLSLVNCKFQTLSESFRLIICFWYLFAIKLFIQAVSIVKQLLSHFTELWLVFFALKFLCFFINSPQRPGEVLYENAYDWQTK